MSVLRVDVHRIILLYMIREDYRFSLQIKYRKPLQYDD